MNWSTNAWEQIQPIYNTIIKMPFITELMDGTLPVEKFQFYMAQDSHYLEHFDQLYPILRLLFSYIPVLFQRAFQKTTAPIYSILYCR